MANPPAGVNPNTASQASFYANAAVPTLGSINAQYGQSLGNVSGFTSALVKLLQSQAGADPYAGAVGSQTAANAAAVQRLQNLGSPYAAGSAAAVGGMGDSALGALNANRGAAKSYLGQMPGVAAARGQLAQAGLLQQKGQAITQRNAQYQSAYAQALQQLRSFGLQQNAQRIQQAQFNSSQAQQWREFLMSQATSRANAALSASGSTTGATGQPPNIQQILNGNTSSLSKASGLTPNELSTQIKNANALLNPSPTYDRVAIKNAAGQITGYRNVPRAGTGGSNPVSAGVSFQTALNQLQAQGGVNPVVAFYAVAKLYAAATRSQYSSPSIATAYTSFVQWMANRGIAPYVARWKNMTPGPRGRRGGH